MAARSVTVVNNGRANGEVSEQPKAGHELVWDATVVVKARRVNRIRMNTTGFSFTFHQLIQSPTGIYGLRSLPPIFVPPQICQV